MHFRSRLLLLTLILGLGAAFPASAAETGAKGLRYPSLTPDGKSVVFCYRGDLWIAPVDGSRKADRLTIHEEQDTLCRVSPDGQSVAFSSKRNGGYDLYTVPVTGGLPKQITFHSTVEILCEWSPDGKRLLFMSNREPGEGRMDLYEVDIEGGTPHRITRDGAREATYSPDGKSVVYVRGFNDIYWDNYEGSANYDIYVIDVQGGMPRRLTDSPGNERYPCYAADGKTIFFIAEEKGVANWYSMPLEGGARAQVTKYTGNDVHRPCLGYDHKTAVFEIAGQLFTSDLTAPAEKPTPVNVAIESDVRNSGIEVRTITSGGEQVHVSGDGRTLAFTLRGDIWLMAAAGGNARRVTQGPANDQWPRLSPDGQTIAYFTNQSGNSDIVLLDLKSGRVRPVVASRSDEFFHNWSPDGKKLVFCREINGNKDIWTIDLESGQETQLTREAAPDDDPNWSPDGRQIVFDSGRGGTQDIYVMNADGSDVRQVTQGAAFFQVPSFSPDGRLIVFEVFQPAGAGQSGGLYVVGAQGGPTMQISRDGSTACWSPDGSTIYFAADRGGENSGIFRTKAPESIVAGERVPFVGTVEVDLRKELGDLFDEAWTLTRDGFYDAKMHGVDWNAMKQKYRDMAIDAENKDEFHNTVRQMLAELGASHLGISGGNRIGSSVTPPGEETGYLGVAFDEAPTEEGARRIESVLAGGPGDKAGLRVGDVVVRIGKEKLEAKTNLDRVLAGLVGKDTAISFRPQSAAGLGEPRSVTLKPIGWGQVGAVVRNEWLATCARRVEEGTKTKEGEVGYIHLDSMNPQNLMKFQQAVAGWNRDKKIHGMVLDVRNNGGGNIHQQLIAILQNKPLAEVQMRGGPRQPQPGIYWDRPVVLLTNERSFSDAEVFPYMFRAAGLGKIVGMPTAGGVIGTNDVTLSDGSRFRVPRTGFWGMDGTNLEGLGVKPDYRVEETSEDRLTGRDPQLAKAIEVILEEIKAQKSSTPPTPPTPPKPVTPKPTPEAAPTPTPEPSPASSPATFDTLSDVVAGEWVRYRAVLPDAGKESKESKESEESVVKVTVVAIEGGAVLLSKEIEKGASNVPALPDRMSIKPLLEALASFGEITSSELGTARILDQDVSLLHATVKWSDGSALRFTFTNAIPAYGLWRVEREGTVILEAIEWGGAPTPAPETASEPARPDNPLWDAKAGEWLKFRRLGRDGKEMELKLTVEQVTDSEVVLQQAIVVAGREMSGPPMRRPRERTLLPPGELEPTGYSQEILTVAGQELDCIVMTATDPQGGAMKWWHCPTLPVNGLVRMERDGVVALELVEWGEG